MVTAQFVSELGDGITTVALPLYVYARTSSPLATSLTFMAELLAGVVLGVVGGMLADSFDRRRVLLWSYLIRAALLIAAVAVEPLWLVIVFGVLARAGGQLDNPSFDAMVPEHADGDLQQVLALRRLVQSISYTIGPAVGALAVTVVGPRRALLLNSVTFVVAVLLLSGLRGLDRSVAERQAAHAGQGLRERLDSMLDGVRVLLGTRLVRRLILYWTIVMATVAVVMAAAIIWFEEDLGVADAWYGISVAAYGIGATLGLGWAGGRRFRLSLATILVISAPIYAASCVMGVVALEPWLLPSGLVGVGHRDGTGAGSRRGARRRVGPRGRARAGVRRHGRADDARHGRRLRRRRSDGRGNRRPGDDRLDGGRHPRARPALGRPSVARPWHRGRGAARRRRADRAHLPNHPLSDRLDVGAGVGERARSELTSPLP